MLLTKYLFADLPSIPDIVTELYVLATQFGAEWADGQFTPLLYLAVILAGIGTTALFIIAALAYRQRPTTRYLLIAVAVGLLLVRSIVGFGTILGVVPMTMHHLVEHSFDFLIAVLVLYAVYRTSPTGDTTVRGPG